MLGGVGWVLLKGVAGLVFWGFFDHKLGHLNVDVDSRWNLSIGLTVTLFVGIAN
jgi:hypothetical protein